MDQKRNAKLFQPIDVVLDLHCNVLQCLVSVPEHLL